MDTFDKHAARRSVASLSITALAGALAMLSTGAASQAEAEVVPEPAASKAPHTADDQNTRGPCRVRCGDRIRVRGPKAVFSFDPDSGRYPEGIAISRNGSIYLGIQPTGEIVRLGPHGRVSTLVDLDQGGGFMLGIALDAQENLYAALPSFDPLTHGVWQIDRRGNGKLIAAMPTSSLPNALAFDTDGNLYVTDTFLGAVWKLSKSGSFDLWLADPLLEGTGALFGAAAGANGIAFNDEGAGSLYVTNTDRGTIVRIPIRGNGAAGRPAVFAEADSLVSADGLKFDTRGHLYVVVNLKGTLARVDRCGHVRILASGIDRPAELAFGVAHRERQVLYVTTFGLDSGEHLVKVDVGIRGLPVP